MTATQDRTKALVPKVLAASYTRRRRMVAVAGAPGSGKSTLAQELCSALNQQGCQSQVVPMDGFHLDNRILADLGLLEKKGAPDTFDTVGFRSLVSRLANDREVFFPLFDRDRDIAIAAAGVVGPDCDTVVVEGNYLLFDAPGWADLSDFWDVSIQLSVERSELRRRLVNRWLSQGLSLADAERRADGNDLPNADLIAAAPMPHDIAV